MHFTNFNYGFDKVGGLRPCGLYISGHIVGRFVGKKKGKNWILMQTKALSLTLSLGKKELAGPLQYVLQPPSSLPFWL